MAVSDYDQDKYCMTNKGLMLWKDIAQDAFDQLEYQRSSLNKQIRELYELQAKKGD